MLLIFVGDDIDAQPTSNKIRFASLFNFLFVCFQVHFLLISLYLFLSLAHTRFGSQYCCRHVAAHPFRPPDHLLWLLVYSVSSIAQKPAVWCLQPASSVTTTSKFFNYTLISKSTHKIYNDIETNVQYNHYHSFLFVIIPVLHSTYFNRHHYCVDHDHLIRRCSPHCFFRSPHINKYLTYKKHTHYNLCVVFICQMMVQVSLSSSMVQVSLSSSFFHSINTIFDEKNVDSFMLYAHPTCSKLFIVIRKARNRLIYIH